MSIGQGVAALLRGFLPELVEVFRASGALPDPRPGCHDLALPYEGLRNLAARARGLLGTPLEPLVRLCYRRSNVLRASWAAEVTWCESHGRGGEASFLLFPAGFVRVRFFFFLHLLIIFFFVVVVVVVVVACFFFFSSRCPG